MGSAVTPMALVVLAASTAAYAYFVDRGHVSDADREARRLDVFPSFRVEDVRRVEVAHEQEVMVLERDAAGGAWAMRSPRAGGTDAAAVDSLLRELEMAVRLRSVQPSDAVGLDNPRARGRIVVGPVDYRFELGADAPRPEGAAYMRVDGEGVFVAGRSLKVQLLRSADAYRDRTVVPLGAGDVARLEVRAQTSLPVASGSSFVFERNGASFRVGRRDGLRASRAVVDRVFSALAEARADMFVTESEADRVVAAPERTVILTPREAASPRVTLLVGGPCPTDGRDVVVVRTEPTRLGACVARHAVDGLGVTRDQLVDRGAFFAHADEIEEIRLEFVGASTPRVDLARRGNGWHERSPEDRDLSPDEVDSANVLALALAGGQAIDARSPDGPERGESNPVHTRATIVRTGGRTTEVLEIAPPDPGSGGETSRARRLDDGAILRFDRAVARRFEPHPSVLRSLSPWRTPIDPGSVVEIDDSCSEPPQRLELRDGSWTAGAGAVAVGQAPALHIDSSAAADLVSAFARAKADARLTENDDGSFGFGRDHACAVTLTLGADPGGGGPRKVGIVFGAQDAGEVYGREIDDPAVFVAPVVLREIASHPVLDRSRFRLDPGALSRVTLARSGGKLVLLRSGGSVDRLVRGGGGPEDAAADDKLEAALAGLYAQYALHAGPAAAAEGLDRPMLEIDTVAANARSDGGAPLETRISIGAPVHESAVDGYFARVAGVDATFLVPRHLVSAILDAW
jgi:hypothetical protein